MENIILQIVQNAAKNILKYYETNGICRLDKMTDELKHISEEMTKQMLATFIESADKSICAARTERKEDGIRVHERNVPRTLYTSLGEFTYKRTYFDSSNGKTYLMDNILGVSAYERVDAGISAKLVNAAALHSYGRSASIVTGGNVSRQSAWNKAMNTGEVAFIPQASASKPEALHIFADEDHVSLQDGKNAIVPLVTVCAGKQSVGKGRNELIEPFHVHGYGMDKGTLWEYVYALCAVKYDMESIPKIYIYGDGASWIKGGLDVFTKAIYSIDKFHYKKYMRKLFTGEVGSKYALKAYAAVAADDKATFEEIANAVSEDVLSAMPDGTGKTKKYESIRKTINYLLNNWSGIQNSRLPGVIGSCTEALISHILSARLSRNPMGWSKKGLAKMAMIRVFVMNGETVTPIDTLSWKHSSRRFVAADKIEKYEDIIKSQHDAIFKDVKTWGWFEKDCKISGKTSGTKVVLDSLSKLKRVS
jgi:hypothetical protein